MNECNCYTTERFLLLDDAKNCLRKTIHVVNHINEKNEDNTLKRFSYHVYRAYGDLIEKICKEIDTLIENSFDEGEERARKEKETGKNLYTGRDM